MTLETLKVEFDSIVFGDLCSDMLLSRSIIDFDPNIILTLRTSKYIIAIMNIFTVCLSGRNFLYNFIYSRSYTISFYDL